jgi:glutathione S-transferase
MRGVRKITSSPRVSLARRCWNRSLVDGDMVMGESGAILEYVLEAHGNGRLAPAIGSRQRGEFLQWVHFAEGTAFPPLGVLIWHGIYRGVADRIPDAIDAARERAHSALAVLERHLSTREHLLGAEFSAADIMVGFTVAAAQFLGLLDSRYPFTAAYLTSPHPPPANDCRAETDGVARWRFVVAHPDSPPPTVCARVTP